MLKRLIFWDYKRGSWQYNVIVGLIVAFIFLTPRPWFRDWPRTPQAKGIATVPGGYFVSPDKLADISDSRACRSSPSGCAPRPAIRGWE